LDWTISHFGGRIAVRVKKHDHTLKGIELLIMFLTTGEI